jgi:hypothetical protein
MSAVESEMDKIEKRWRSLVVRSKKAKRDCCSPEEFRDWYGQQERVCAYCGIEEVFLAKYCTARNDTKSLHIDRRTNSQGYVIGNMFLACRSCNCIIKSSKTEDFIGVVVKAILQAGMLDEYHLWNVPADKREAACGWHQFSTGDVFQRGDQEITRIYRPNEFHYMPEEELARRIKPVENRDETADDADS